MKLRRVSLSLVLVILTILVIDGNAGAATIYVPDNYGTIQLAINNATNGDTIIVRDGTYSEHIELGTLVANTKNNLTIQAENQGSATIQYTSGGAVPVVYIEGDSGGVPIGTTIDGFNLVRSGSGRGAGVFVKNSNTSTYATVTVKNCVMSGNEMRSGVRLDGYIQATITGNTITGPQDAGIATSASPGSPPNDDYLYGNSQITIEDNTINGNGITDQAGIFLKGDDSGNTVQVVIGGTGQRNYIYNNGTAGIRLEDIYDAVTIDNNEVNNNLKAGICIIDVGSGTATATIRNNDIHDNTKAGITVAGASYLTIGNNNEIHENGEAGIAFRKASITVLYSDPINVSSQPVTITSNNIYSNAEAGIAVIDNVTGAITIDNNVIYSNPWAGVSMWDGVGTVTLTTNTIRNNGAAGINISYDGASPADQTVTIENNNHIHSNGMAGVRNDSADSLTIVGNDIYSNGGSGIRNDYGSNVTIDQNNIYLNTMAGIGIQNDCTMVITKNKIYSNNRGGIHTGTDVEDPGGFSGTAGFAVLTIKQNKVYGNGESDYGGGIDVRHASGTIYNNLVYRNHRGGIRFGGWITETVNNTVAHNGNDNNTPADPTDDIGGGIIYDDINAGDAVNAQPEGTLADSPNYPNPRIRNNISAYNVWAGIRVGNKPTGLTACPGNPDYTDSIKYRDYNLLYSNHLWNTAQNRWNDPDCKYPGIDFSCFNQQYGGCGAYWDPPPTITKYSPNDERQDPLFVSITEGSENYHLQSIDDGYPQDSPAIDAGASTYGNDVSLPPGEGTSTIDMGAYGGPLGINW